MRKICYRCRSWGLETFSWRRSLRGRLCWTRTHYWQWLGHHSAVPSVEHRKFYGAECTYMYVRKIIIVPEIWISGSLQLVFLGWIPYSNSNDSIETTSYPCPPACMHACLYMYVCMRVCMYECMYVCVYVCMYGLFWAQEVAIFIFKQYIQFERKLRDGHTYTHKVRAD